MEGDDVDMTETENKQAELDNTKTRLKEMDEEATALREMQAKVEREMGSTQDPAAAATSQANCEEVDSVNLCWQYAELKNSLLRDLRLSKHYDLGLGLEVDVNKFLIKSTCIEF